MSAATIQPLPPLHVCPLTDLAECCLPASAEIEPGESAWNVDGELLPHNAVHIGVARGGVEVFARGVET